MLECKYKEIELWTLKIFQKAYTEKILNKFNYINWFLITVPVDPNVKFKIIHTNEKNVESFFYRKIRYINVFNGDCKIWFGIHYKRVKSICRKIK